MSILSNYLQTGDWKGEKHIPIIHVPERILENELVEIKISIGDAIQHPNTLEHHISWFKLFYIVDGEKFPVELATFYFMAHSESNITTEPCATAKVKLPSSGTLVALSYCNIHGIWENSIKVDII